MYVDLRLTSKIVYPNQYYTTMLTFLFQYQDNDFQRFDKEVLHEETTSDVEIIDVFLFQWRRTINFLI